MFLGVFNEKCEYWVRKSIVSPKLPLMIKNAMENTKSFCHSGAKRRNP
jgi:hypothetical protein